LAGVNLRPFLTDLRLAGILHLATFVCLKANIITNKTKRKTEINVINYSLADSGNKKKHELKPLFLFKNKIIIQVSIKTIQK
jgi:hypothetical protein